MPDLRHLLNSKTAFIDQQQQKLEELLIKLGNQFANDLSRLVERGIFDVNTLLDALDTLGYSEALIRGVRLESETIQSVLDFSRQVSQAQGLNFVLTGQSEAQLFAYLEAVEAKVLAAFRDEIAADMTKFAIESKLSNRPFKQVKNEAAERLAIEGRRAATEVSTSMSIFDRAVMDAVYQQNDVKLFFYFPATLIPTSRDSCTRAVTDPRQQTGWTREDIQNAPDLDFIKGGSPFFNCRHEWISFKAAEAFGS